MTAVLIAAALALSFAARAIILRASAGAGVDHYYWILAARAYREMRHLPARIPGKYLLEDERQAYPPFFGWFLSRFLESWLTGSAARWYPQICDLVLLGLVLAACWGAGVAGTGIAAAVFVVGTAPVLAAYNTQLTSRAFGNLFLFASVLSSAAGLRADNLQIELIDFALSGAAVAGVVLTHKMSLQLLAAVWPVWALAEWDWRLALVPLLGLTIATAVTGVPFGRLQWRAHWEILAFWHRHWNLLGAHAFHDSAVYGGERRGRTLFHQPGWRGALTHATRAVSYNPMAWLLPLSLLWSPAPPLWVLIWSVGPLAAALLTLYVPQLRCLGGGHLYIFNSVAPSAVWWALLIADGKPANIALFALGVVLSAGALLGAWRTRATARGRDTDYRSALTHLAALPPGRLAVFPLTAVEEAAFSTPHAVLWGAHGLGFFDIEPIYPVLQRPIGELMRRYGCSMLLLDTRYWPEGQNCISRELPGADIRTFGAWCLVCLPKPSNDEASDGCAAMPARA